MIFAGGHFEDRKLDENISQTEDSGSATPSSPKHHSINDCQATIEWGYDGMQGTGYHALASYAVFVGMSRENAAYKAFHEIDKKTDIQLSYLPMHFEVMTGNDHE